MVSAQNQLTILVLLCAVCSRAVVALKHKSEYLVGDGIFEVEPAYKEFNGTMSAGLMPVDLARDKYKDSEIMFWLFEPEHPTVADTMVIWLNGGPGCSSFAAGASMENSPVTVPLRESGYCCMTGRESFGKNPYAWTEATAILYVEQPVGTGFSHGPEPKDEDELSRDFYSFLVHFYQVFDHLQTYNLFFFGESYAGMYVPSIARRIYLENQHKNKPVHINLAGIALGNGWIDATVQGPAVIDYAWWHGMIDSTTRDALHSEWEHCYPPPKDGAPEPKPFHSFTTPDECAIMPAILKAAGAGILKDGRSPNTYDVTTWDPYKTLIDNYASIGRFYNNPTTQKALNVPNTLWRACIPGEGRRRRLKEDIPDKLLLDDDRPISVVPYIAELLDKANIRVLIYNGDRDLSTNAQGSEMLLDSMNWSGREKWTSGDTPRGLWLVDGDPAGYTKELDNLGFLVVYNSGHLVPYNQPARALDLVTRFLKGDSFSDAKLPSFPMMQKSKKQKQQTESSHPSGRGMFSMMTMAVVFFLAGYLASNVRHRRRYQQQYERLGSIEA